MENQLPPERPPRGLPLFWLGVLLFVAGPVTSFVLLGMKWLVSPWYLPVLATLGALCMVASVVQRGGIVRTVATVVFVLLCGLEWFFVAHVIKTPAYTGPAQPGQKLPEFAATYADGRPFTTASLEDGHRTAMLFFRGRW